jgi:tetrahydromethanopterin S-methyltransferase subunit G
LPQAERRPYLSLIVKQRRGQQIGRDVTGLTQGLVYIQSVPLILNRLLAEKEAR